MKKQLLRALARRAWLVTWIAVFGWIAYVVGTMSGGRTFRPGWLGTLFFILVASALLKTWVASWRRMVIRESALPVLPRRGLRDGGGGDGGSDGGGSSCGGGDGD